MPKIIEDDDGKQMEVFTAEDVAAREAAASAAAIEKAQTDAKIELDKVQADLAEQRRINAERGENFTRYSKMTEDEKKAYDANTTTLLKREESLLTEMETLKTTLSQKEQAERESTKNAMLKGIYGDKEDLKKQLEDSYTVLAGMPETTAEEIRARTMAAARLAGISVSSPNPLYAAYSGDAPNTKDTKDYSDTPEGKEAARLVREAMQLKEVK